MPTFGENSTELNWVTGTLDRPALNDTFFPTTEAQALGVLPQVIKAQLTAFGISALAFLNAAFNAPDSPLRTLGVQMPSQAFNTVLAYGELNLDDIYSICTLALAGGPYTRVIAATPITPNIPSSTGSTFNPNTPATPRPITIDTSVPDTVQLADLLGGLFRDTKGASTPSLRDFIASISPEERLDHSLPGETSSMSHLALETADLLRRRGYIDAELFAALRRQFPDNDAAIRLVAKAFRFILPA